MIFYHIIFNYLIISFVGYFFFNFIFNWFAIFILKQVFKFIFPIISSTSNVLRFNKFVISIQIKLNFFRSYFIIIINPFFITFDINLFRSMNVTYIIIYSSFCFINFIDSKIISFNRIFTD